MQDFFLDTNTPMPETTAVRYPFAEMAVGHSLFTTSESRKESIRVAARQFVRTHQPDWQFKTMSDGEGWRIWRIK